LAKVAAKKAVILPDVFFQVIEDLSVKTVEPKPRMINIIQGEEWRASITAYLRNHYEPDSRAEMIRIQQRVKAYQIIEEELYKTSVTRPCLRCSSKDEGKEMLNQTHAGACGGHIRERALAVKVFRQGFYWPSIIDDATKLVKTCQACQKFSPNIQAPSQPTQLITPSWLLQRWGIGIVGPLIIAQGTHKFAVVVVKYFTKWIEVNTLVNIVVAGLKRFFWQNIICQFGVPREITVDNAKQFDCHLFKEFCYQIEVEAVFTSVYHPQSNEAAEKANTLIFTAIKKILENQSKGKWVEELPRAVWSHNTSVCRATKFTPFKLLYGEEPITPEEIKLHIARTNAEAVYSPTKAESKDLLEPERMKVVKNLQSYQNETKAWRDKEVRLKNIDVGDLVLIRSPRTEASSKLEPKWTGPFVVTEKTWLGSFRLADNEGRVLEHSWNADNLHRFFI
jgi:hypothetical protein